VSLVNTVTRLADRWMEHATHGVNALQATQPRNRPGGGTDSVPPSVTVYNDVDDEEVATEIDPPASPALTIWMDSEIDITWRGTMRAKGVTLAFAYTTRHEADLVAIRNSGYCLGGVMESLERFNDQKLAVGYRELNGWKIMEVSDITLQRAAGTVGESRLWGFVLAHLVVVKTT